MAFMSSRVVLALGMSLSSAGYALAQTSPPAPAQPAPAQPAAPKELKPGDPAPALNIAHWAKGDPVKSFEKGTVYVVEFWATWCGPCIQNIPKLTALQAKHKDDGLVVIGVSSADRRGIDDVRPFVEKQGERMNYRVAVDDEFKTGRAYMEATGQGGIPCAYVIDKAGKLAWFGHPANNMEGVVDQVLKGEFDPAKYVDPQKKFAELDTRLRKAATDNNLEDADKVFAELKALRPELATQFDVNRFFFLYTSLKDKPKAIAYAGELLKGPLGTDAAGMIPLAYGALNDASPAPEDLRFAREVMEKSVALSSRSDPRSLSILGDVFKKSGEYDKAIALNEEALSKVQDDGTKKSLELKLDMIKKEAQAAKAKPADAPAVNPG